LNLTYPYKRSVLIDSPGNYTVFLPNAATNETIDLINFKLNDYTGKFKWSNTILYLSKNNSIISSNFFDADAKIQSYLIRGDSYSIIAINNITGDIYSWGNYVASGSGNIDIVLSELGANTTKYAPFNFTVAISTSTITTEWRDISTVLNSINILIQEGESKTIVHNITSSAKYGSDQYIITNSSDVYYVTVTANTSFGTKTYYRTVDWRPISRYGKGYVLDYGTFSLPDNYKNAIATLILFLLAGCFGYVHRSEGSIITGIFTGLFWWFGWLPSISTATFSYLGSLIFLAFVYHLQQKGKQ